MSAVLTLLAPPGGRRKQLGGGVRRVRLGERVGLRDDAWVLSFGTPVLGDVPQRLVPRLRAVFVESLADAVGEIVGCGRNGGGEIDVRRRHLAPCALDQPVDPDRGVRALPRLRQRLDIGNDLLDAVLLQLALDPRDEVEAGELVQFDALAVVGDERRLLVCRAIAAQVVVRQLLIPVLLRLRPERPALVLDVSAILIPMSVANGKPAAIVNPALSKSCSMKHGTPTSRARSRAANALTPFVLISATS
jgi:hypothetical protein